MTTDLTDLYVLFLRDGRWARSAWNEAAARQCVYYVDYNAADGFLFTTTKEDAAEINISDKELLGRVSQDIVRNTVEKARSDTFFMYMDSRRDGDEGPDGGLGGRESFGSWNQTFVIVAPKILEHDAFLEKGLTEKYQKKI